MQERALDQTTTVHNADDLVLLFNQCFEQSFNTILVGGAEEPIYRPQSANCRYHQIYFRHDYFASALHEVAHWCVAGPARRRLEDYGYWYAPDGRTALQQMEFERVEVKPQAIEWLFSVACGLSFRVSADNLQMGLGASTIFKAAIVRQAQDYCRLGLGARPDQFARALASFYHIKWPVGAAIFTERALD